MADLDTEIIWDTGHADHTHFKLDDSFAAPIDLRQEVVYDGLSEAQKRELFAELAADTSLVLTVTDSGRKIGKLPVLSALVGIVGFGVASYLPTYTSHKADAAISHIGEEFCTTPDTTFFEDGALHSYGAQVEVCLKDTQITGPITVFGVNKDVQAELVETWFRSTNTGDFESAKKVEKELGGLSDSNVSQIMQSLKQAAEAGYIQGAEQQSLRLALPLSGNTPLFENVPTDYTLTSPTDNKNGQQTVKVEQVLLP